MMNLAQILKNIEWGRKQRAEFVRIISYRYGYKRSNLMPKAIAKAYSKRDGYTSAYKYVCSIECVDSKSNVKVSCSCPDFCFQYEYVLARRNAADIVYCNGEAPQEPKKPGCCKHIFMLVKELRANGKLKSDLTFKFPG